MENITSVAGLKNAIQLLEAEQNIKGELLKKQVIITYESLKPANLIRNTLKDLFSTSFQGENITGIAAGMTSGYLLKKLLVGRSGSPYKKILGLIIQYGVTNIMARNSQSVKSFADLLFGMLSRKKK